MISGPCAVSWGSERLDVFASKTDLNNELLWLTYDGTANPVKQLKDPARPLNGSQGCGPACAASWDAGRFDVFALNAENQMLHWWYEPANFFGDPGINNPDLLLANEQPAQNLPQNTPAAVSPGLGQLVVAATAPFGEGTVVDLWIDTGDQ